MGIAAKEGESATVAEQLHNLPSDRKKQLRMPGENGPILLPAHLDALVQTSPTPEPEPFIELFLHGPGRGVADVQVVWRADLEGADPKDWWKIVSLCPPSSREAMPVQISAFRRWFSGDARADEMESDVEGSSAAEDDSEEKRRIPALAWRGDPSESRVVWEAGGIRPGDTTVLRVSEEGWNELGHIPEGAAIDVGDQARFELQRGVSLRLHPNLIKEWPQKPSWQSIEKRIGDDDLTKDDAEDLLSAYSQELQVEGPAAFLNKIEQLSQLRLEKYPGEAVGYVLQGRVRHGDKKNNDAVFLDDHLRDSENATGKLGTGAVDSTLLDALKTAARFHDYGKADVRYQAWLRGGDTLAALYAPRPIAKSGRVLTRRQQDCGLPEDFRMRHFSLLLHSPSTGRIAPIQSLKRKGPGCGPFMMYFDATNKCVDRCPMCFTMDQRQETGCSCFRWR